MTNKIRSALILLSGSLILGYWAFVNHFPLVFSDTGTYLSSGFTNDFPADRPIFYGWFIRHLSLEDSLYIPVFVQCIMLAYCLKMWVVAFGHKSNQNLQFLILITILTVFTGASVQTSQLIPDVFTPILLLSAGLLLTNASIGKWRYLTMCIFFLLSLLMHNSHSLIIWLVLLGLTTINLVRFWGGYEHYFNRSWLIIAGLTISSHIIIPSTSYALGFGYNSSRARHVIIMNRLVKFGIMEDYLNDVCAEKDYKFCAYKDAIPRSNFMWDHENSPLYLTGGWEANEEEYNTITNDILKRSKYYPKLFFRALESSGHQFFSYKIGDTAGPYLEKSSPHSMIKYFFPELERFYFRAKQQEGNLDFVATNRYHHILILTSLTLCFFFLFRQRTKWVNRNLLEIILIFLIANAAVCGALVGAFDRYQCRVVFVLIVPLYLAIWRLPSVQKFLKSDENQ
ncbi:MAG: hypothetical protein AAF741_18750 [Bacteroidota bacterium]